MATTPDEVCSSVTESESYVEIRLLGPLRVRRGDGTPVRPTAWRTRKTADLLRLLALESGHPVSVAHLVESLWGEVPEQRGRASLRTAASTIRQALGPGCIERVYGGLALREAWVDSVAFGSLARELHSHARAGTAARVVATAREAQALYLDDLSADDESGTWAHDERLHLRTSYLEVLEEAGAAALQLGWHRDAVSFASRAIALDPCAERPVRTLMTACASLGEQEQALRAFHRCRRSLAEELGVDPSPLTDRLHVSLLTGEIATTAPPPPPFVCRRSQLDQVVAALQEQDPRGGPKVLELRGDEGCGRRRLLAEACARTGRTYREVTDLTAGVDADEVRLASAAVLERHVRSPRPPAHHSSRPSAPHTAPQTAPTTIVTSGDVPDAVRDALLAQGWAWQRVSLPRLTLEETGTLASAVLGGPVGRDLLDHIGACTSGTPASVVSTTRALLRAGRVRSTPDGLTVVEGDAVQDVEARTAVARALEELAPESHEVLHAVALLRSPATMTALLPALSGDPEAGSVRRALDRLVDLELLTTGPTGYRFRHPLVAASVRGWSRPSVRRALHTRIAERALVPALDRVHHWLEAGEPELACAAAVDASTAALAAERYEEARECLLRARALSTALGADPADQAELGEQLGDVCLRLGRLDEAAEVYATTLRPTTGVAAGRPERPTAGPVAVVLGRSAPGAPPGPRPAASRPWTLHKLAAQLGVLPDSPPTAELEGTLRTALQEADASSAGDARERAAGIRILLADRVLIPRRRLTLAREVLEPVSALRSRPDLLGRATLSRWWPDVLRGDARGATGPLLAATAATTDAGTRTRLQWLSLLARHDLGLPVTDADLGEPTGPGAGPWGRWLAVRVLAESGRTAEAEAWPAAPPTRRTTMMRQLDLLATAELHESRHDPDAAITVLRTAADDAVRTGTVLLLPELAARLVILESGRDDGRAQDDFDLMDRALGGEPAYPRETYYRLLARAHVRAQHREPERAAVAAEAAHAVAAEHGLTVLRRRAEGVRRALLEMERRRRVSDLIGGPDAPAPTGLQERRTQFARTRTARPPAPRDGEQAQTWSGLRAPRTPTTAGPPPGR